MSLDISKLEHVRGRGKKTIAPCPACAEAGEDRKGEHLVINENGSFGCVLYPGNSPEARAHRKQIFALCGDKEIRPLIVHANVYVMNLSRPKPVRAVRNRTPGRDGRIQAHIAPYAKTNLLDLLERQKPTTSGPRKILKPVEKVSISAACEQNNVLAVLKLSERKCVICGNPFNGAPASEYCGNECATEGHHRWIAEGRNPTPAQIKQLRRQCGRKAVADRNASEDFATWLRNFEKRIRRDQ